MVFGLFNKINSTTRFKSGGFRYPLEALTETTDYLSFTIVEYQSVQQRGGGSLVGSPGSRRIGPQGTKDKATKILGNIILQMPSNIQDGNAVDYGESKMNTLIGAAAGAISSGIEGAGKSISELLQGNQDVSGQITNPLYKETFLEKQNQINEIKRKKEAMQLKIVRCRRLIKQNLKDPSSFKVLNSYSEQVSTGIVRYSATNSFGARVQEAFDCNRF